MRSPVPMLLCATALFSPALGQGQDASAPAREDARIAARIAARDAAENTDWRRLAPALEADVRAALQEQFDAQRLVGLAAAIVVDGELAFQTGLGHADREEGVLVTSDTLFRWASISKPVAAVAAMQLVAKDELDLDRDVRTYVPEFPEKPWPVTSRQLLGHLGGVIHYRNGHLIKTEREYDVEHPFADLVLALDTFKESPLVCEPGSKFSYTTHGYILLGAVVQRAGGAPFADQVRARISVPLGMDTFRPDYQWEEIPNRAKGYRKWGQGVIPSTNTDVSWKLPGGGYLSNVGDLARFARGMLGRALVDEETRRAMWTAQATSDGKPTGYGLGFGIGTSDGKRVVSHSGSQEKTRTLMRIFPDERMAVVLMTNSEYAKLAPVADAVFTALRAPAETGGK